MSRLSLHLYFIVLYAILPVCLIAEAGTATNPTTTPTPNSAANPNAELNQKPAKPNNLALYATVSTSYVSGHEHLDAINSGYEPRRASDHTHGGYGNWPKRGPNWVEYRWSKPISTNESQVYWWGDGHGIKPPTSAGLLFWNGNGYAPIPGAAAAGIASGRYNSVTFPTITTDRLRLEFGGDGTFSTGILQWKVMDSGQSPIFAPTVNLNGDHVCVLPSPAHLQAHVRGESASLAWSKASGPGNVQFARDGQGGVTATFSRPGQYVIRVTANNPPEAATAEMPVHVVEAPASHLNPVFMTRYSLDSPLWSDRIKQLIIHWIPHCIAELSKPDLPEGGIENFIQAGNRNAARPFKPHAGAPWADAYTLNAVESMCVALQVDPQGDPQIIAAQDAMRQTLEKWIPIILAAQEPDGYLQTRFTLGMRDEYPHRPPRWTLRSEHEGYVAGYFIDAAVADYLLNNGKDRRMYDAAKKLADCWNDHIGPPPKKRWADGHEEIEQALVRLARLVDHVEGPGKGDRYVKLAKFLLSCRGGGSTYDQNQAPVTQQYYAAGHAVRAAYCYSAMADIAMETGDTDYHTAVRSIWDDLVNRKYYVTGGIGSGATAEGFGPDFALPNDAYCESCSSCGEIFFQHNMNLAYTNASYADLTEGTLYNALLSSIDLEAENFTYTNSLDTSEGRHQWHSCPCCVGNIPRTLLMLPTWTYATGKSANGQDALYVNLYIGSTMHVDLNGSPVKITQKTNYPQSGHVELTIKPGTARQFAVYVRAPDRGVSELYQYTPPVNGITSLCVNGQMVDPVIINGYVRIDREWHPGDTIAIDLPMVVQRVHADERVVADRGKVALRYGPLIYTFEAADQNLQGHLSHDAQLDAEWEPTLLRGVTVIRGAFRDGSPLMAIPYYARNNRGGRSTVWIAEQHQ